MPAGIIKSEDLFVTKSSAEMLVVQLEKGLYELSVGETHRAPIDINNRMMMAKLACHRPRSTT